MGVGRGTRAGRPPSSQNRIAQCRSSAVLHPAAEGHEVLVGVDDGAFGGLGRAGIVAALVEGDPSPRNSSLRQICGQVSRLPIRGFLESPRATRIYGPPRRVKKRGVALETHPLIRSSLPGRAKGPTGGPAEPARRGGGPAADGHVIVEAAVDLDGAPVHVVALDGELHGAARCPRARRCDPPGWRRRARRAPSGSSPGSSGSRPSRGRRPRRGRRSGANSRAHVTRVGRERGLRRHVVRLPPVARVARWTTCSRRRPGRVSVASISATASRTMNVAPVRFTSSTAPPVLGGHLLDLARGLVAAARAARRG